jgi:hypothetical protein
VIVGLVLVDFHGACGWIRPISVFEAVAVGIGIGIGIAQSRAFCGIAIWQLGLGLGLPLQRLVGLISTCF